MTTSEVLHIPGCKCRQAIGDGKGGFLLMVEDYCPVHGNPSKPDRLNLEAAAAVAATVALGRDLADGHGGGSPGTEPLQPPPPEPGIDSEVPW